MSSNRKRKKSFLQQATKYGKKGNYGRGTNITEETFQYFLHILKVLNRDFETLDEKDLFAENVFKQLEGNEVSYCCNQVISFIADKLVPFACDDTVIKLMNEFGTNPRPVFLDPYCSFVLQKLLIVCTKRLKINEPKDSNDETSHLYVTYRNWILKMAKFAVNNLEHFIWDCHANPVVRTALACLSGVPDLNTNILDNEFNEMKEQRVVIDEEFMTVVKGCIVEVMSWPQFSELPFNDVVSGLLQILLYVASIIDKKQLKSLSSALTKKAFKLQLEEQTSKSESTADNDPIIPQMFENNSSLRILEVIISLSTRKRWLKVYEKIFANHLLKFSTHGKANFSVQKLIMHCPEKEQFEVICNQLLPNLECIFSSGNTGIILQLCEGCVKFKSNQSQFTQHWFSCLRCDEESAELDRVFCTLYMSKKSNTNSCVAEIGDNDSKPVQKIALHGSLLLQKMLHFNKPIKIVKGILESDTNKLVRILCDPRGSYIADAFIDSEYIGEKNKDNFIKKLQGCYTMLCCSKSGSRVFDAVWKYAKINRKVSIMTELCDNQSILEGSQYGKCISRNVSLHTFRHRREHWLNSQNDDKKIMDLFADIM